MFILIKYSGRIAQLAEQLTLNQRVVGSSPTAPTNIPKYLQYITIAVKTLRQLFIELDNALGNKRIGLG